MQPHVASLGTQALACHVCVQDSLRRSDLVATSRRGTGSPPGWLAATSGAYGDMKEPFSATSLAHRFAPARALHACKDSDILLDKAALV